MKIISPSGFSLIEVLIALTIVGGISLVVMQLTKNASESQAHMSASVDFIDFRVEVEGILSNPKDCTASFKNTVFNGSSINSNPVQVEIWLGDQNGIRTRKKFSSTDALVKTIGKLTVDDISFTMPDYTAGTNFPLGPGSFKGELSISGTKKVNGKDTTTKKVTKIVHFSFNTDIAGSSTVSSCTLLNETRAIIPKQGFCAPTVRWDNNDVGICPPVAGYTSTRISSCIPTNYRELTCCYIPTNKDSNGWCSDAVEGHSGCFSGCGPGSADYTVDHINGMSFGKNDTNVCCFVPNDSSVTRPFSAPAINQWDSFSGCNPHPGYQSLRIQVSTAGVGNQSSCTFIPQ